MWIIKKISFKMYQNDKGGKKCSIGKTPILKFHHQGKGADRHVTAEMCSNTHQSIGVVIAVEMRKYPDTCIQ